MALEAKVLEAKVLTVSDSSAGGTREDRSGPAVADQLEAAGFFVIERRIVPDGEREVEVAVRDAAAGFAGLVVTTGGTGFGQRDLTPEGTARAVERLAPGLAEAMRAVSPLGRLSRGIAGTLGRAVVCNLPGSPAGAAESLGAVLDVLPHALALVAGDDPHLDPQHQSARHG